MRLTNYKETKPSVYERKIYWLESRILNRNSKLKI